MLLVKAADRCASIKKNAGKICNFMMKVMGEICVLIDFAYIM